MFTHYPFDLVAINPDQKMSEFDDGYYYDEKDTDLASLTSSISNIDVETIDYQAVYARQVFIATVEGQVSVMQDDKLTLLDDSNAYWWLVRIIKTSDVGYIPAEGIETPLERLARFNKIRNTHIDYHPDEFSQRTKHKKVSIANTVSIQSMIIVTDAYDTHLLESFEESKCAIDSVQPQETNTRKSDYDLSRDLTQHFLLQHHAKKPSPPTFHTAKNPKKGLRQLISRPNRSAVCPMKPLSARTLQPEKECLSVLRVFAGNISVKATFNSVLVDESTTATELLSLALERFRLSQQQQGDGVEYYITVKVLDGDEIALSPKDKPLAMFHSLNTHLTTPMPSLTHIRSKVQLTRIGVTTTDQCNKNVASFGENSVIRFLLNKRIKRVNELDGKLRIKIAYYDTPSAAPHSRFSRPFLDRMEKLVAVSGHLCVMDLTRLALTKFHLDQGGHPVSHKNDSKYGMTLVRQDKEYVLSGHRTILDILADPWLNPNQKDDLCFVLQPRLQPSTHDLSCSSLSLEPTTDELLRRIDRTLSSMEQGKWLQTSFRRLDIV